MIKKHVLTLLIFLCSYFYGFGQCLTDDFNSGYGNWTGTGTYQNATAGVTGNGIGFNSTGDEIITNSTLTNPQTLTLWLARSSSTANKTLSIEYSTSNTGPWTSARNILNGEVTTTHQIFAVNLNLTGSYYIKIEMTQRSGGSYYVDDIAITCTSSCTDTADFNNVQSPATGTITTGGVFNVYAQVYELGHTDSPGQGANIEAWIGYNNSNSDPSTWAELDWYVATYSTDVGNNDEYIKEIGSGISSSGIYYYASRFRVNSCEFTYGGFDSGGGDGFWDGTNDINGVLTVDDPATTNVVITEIMYNSLGTDDEWIEICNVSGSTQDISNYIINVGGSIEFTFPVSTTIDDGNCITVSLGSNGDGTYNNDCPFTPDFGIPAGTADNNNLVNSTTTITLYASNGTTTIDVVTYDNVDGADGNGSSIHVTDATQDNLDSEANWQEVVDGGSPGTNSLVSPCSKPEMQLENNFGVDQTCGSFTIDFGSQATGFNTDLTFYIDNEGTLDLTISSFALGGTNSGDFSIVSPATPFTVTSGNTQTVIIQFTPSATSNRIATLTINNNDADEEACSVNIQGIGTTPVPEINIEGDTGSFPNIIDGDTTPSGTDNTLFAAQFIGSSQGKSFRIQNLGTTDLTISSVTIGGINPTDFSVSITPEGTITASSLTTFEITFAPLTAGVKTANISIANNDSDENPYTFRVQGAGNCVASTITISPSSGPEGTIVTVTGINLSSATASFNGLAASVTNISASEMEVTVPTNATTGNLEISDDFGCPESASFTVLDTQISSCEGGTALTELFISEITDATYGSLTYIEIFNASGVNVSLSNYSIRIYANGNTESFTSQTLSGIINVNSTYVITTGTTGPLGDFLCNSQLGGDGTYGNLVSNTLNGINKKTNEHDFIGLYNSGTLVDAFGVFGVNDWMNTLHTTITGDRGFNFRRLNTATPLPQSSFDDNNWNIIDWVGSGSGSCSSNDYSNIGIYDFSVGSPPSVILEPISPVSNCDLTTDLTVAGIEGFNSSGDTQELAYQWYYSAPEDSVWTTVTNSTLYSGAITTTLSISNTISLNKYQYYCQIKEDEATCYQATNAIRLDIENTTWDGSTWDNGTPDINTIAIIDENYATNISGSFEACNLVINAGNDLDVKNSTYVKVLNNVINNGTLIVQTHGAFVQLGDGVSAGIFTNNGTSSVIKETANLNNWYEYTYWCSPVKNQTVENAFPSTSANRRFWFNAQNYLDQTREVGNNNQTLSGQDDIDDNGNDWQVASGIMTEGLGYAATSSTFALLPGTDQATFIGGFLTGDIDVTVYKNDLESQDNNWNLIGNPYPSAISADLFLTENASVLDEGIPISPPIGGVTEGAIFIWSQNSPPSNSNNGNENSNFSQSDYAIINLVTEVAGGDGVTPNRFIPSGQAFFIAYDHTAIGTPITGGSTIKQSIVKFRNSMRMADGTSNSQFFRTYNPIDNKLWLNLTTDNGAFSQVAMAYVENATNEYDSFSYDTPRNLSSEAYTSIYTIIEEAEDMKFAIQSKVQNSLTLNEIIPLGFDTTIATATLYTISISHLEGVFLTNNNIYLKDDLMNVIHDLSASDYIFTSEIGEFKYRFEIIFSNSLSVDESEFNSNELNIIELRNSHVKFTVSDHNKIKFVTIIDVLGRVLYQLKGSSNSETYNLSNLSQSTYIAKIELFNGLVITKKAIKRK